MGLNERPGCYGSAVAVSAENPSCRACASRVGCVLTASQLVARMPDSAHARRARQALAVARTVLLTPPEHGVRGEPARAVVASSRGRKRMTLSEREEAIVARLPAKVASAVRSAFESGWFEHARTELAAGRNPAEKGWRKVLCHAMLGQWSRPQVIAAFQGELGLTESSAKVQVSVGIAMFAAGGLIVDAGGRLRFNPDQQ
jgi:hypothetical protein